MGFVIWGAGRWGKQLMDFLEHNNVDAFIDNNLDMVEESCQGKPVISFQGYLDSYSEHFIIVSVLYCQGIIETLKENNISHYFLLSDCPHELYALGKLSVLKQELIPYHTDTPSAIYGMNLFSIIVYKYLQEKGCRDICIIPDRDTPPQLLQLFRLAFPKIPLYNAGIPNPDRADTIYITADNREKPAKAENAAAINLYDMAEQCTLKMYANPALKKFHNLHKGKRGFIVATGPSLKMSDLDKLYENNELCISMNGIFHAFQHTNWRPNYYLTIAEKFLSEMNSGIPGLEAAMKFTPDYYQDFTGEPDEKHYVFHYQMQKFYPGLPRFTEDFSETAYSGGTVTYACLELAAYMGFREVYLLGVDFSYFGDVKNVSNHFSTDYHTKEEVSRNKYVGQFFADETFLAYQSAKNYAKEHDTTFYNATRGGKLEVFERVSFDSLFA